MPSSGTALATFAGGCFWCMVQPFAGLEGVREAVSGYTEGHVENPTYEQVCSGTTGHYEAVRVSYDPSVISYRRLVDVFWTQIDPTDPSGQSADKGPQYRPRYSTTMMGSGRRRRNRRPLSNSTGWR